MPAPNAFRVLRLARLIIVLSFGSSFCRLRGEPSGERIDLFVAVAFHQLLHDGRRQLSCLELLQFSDEIFLAPTGEAWQLVGIIAAGSMAISARRRKISTEIGIGPLRVRVEAENAGDKRHECDSTKPYA